jgi:glucose/arabinose dehydrogenase
MPRSAAVRPFVVRCALVLVTAAVAGLHPDPVGAGPATLPTGFSDTVMASSLDLSTGLAEIPDPSALTDRRVLFVEQGSARVGLVAGGSVYTVGTVPGVAFVGERGLLGITVDPGWPNRPFIYVHCNDGRNGSFIAISRFTLTGDLAYAGTGQVAFDAASRYDLRANFPDDASNHNGGSVRFGTDGMLYVSLGDDGVACNAQDVHVAAGKILRLDASRLPASGSGPAPYALIALADNPYASDADSTARLVYTSGLRNPFRFNVDPATNALVIGDVGGGNYEEVDLVTAGGMDMGWPLYEGPDPNGTCTQTPPAPLTGPIAWYAHPAGFAIMGGPLYRQPGVGSLRFPSEYEGDVFFLDYYSGFMRRVKLTGATWAPAAAPGQPNATDWATGLENVSDLIECSDGSIWYCRQTQGGASTGEIRRIAYVNAVNVPPPARPLLALAAPRPNPARGGATLAWTQEQAAPVRLSIYAADGHRVRTLIDAELASVGPHQRVWDGLDDGGRRVRAGIYFVRLEVNEQTRGTRLALLP